MCEKYIYELNEDNIKQINCSRDNYVVDVGSTKDLQYKLLKQIKNKKVLFVIKSALADPNYYDNKDDKYKKRTVFTLNETIKIIDCFNRLDQLVCKNSKFITLEKTLIIYKYLLGKIKYEDKHCFNKKGKDIRRTLNSIVTRKAVCSGFALILFEALVRNNIENYYIHSQNHLFNVVKIDDKYYLLDLTWEATLKNKNKDYMLHFFGNYPLFEDTHIPLNNEKIFNLSYFDSKDIHSDFIKLKTNKKKRQDKTCFYMAQLPFGKKIKYYVIYDKYFSGLDIISSLEDFDRVFNGKDKNLVYFYINDLLNGERIKNKIRNNYGYVGYGEFKDGVFYKHNSCDHVVQKLNKEIKNNNLIKLKYLDSYYSIHFKKNKFSLVKEKIC